ncbi:TetR/AcrR family transcriptional regulator [Promicromonospora sp. NPDC057138]|uniref:TetR/AcrR family transcriptional regulator n=1 Tax=Promicromonospora sp. NPDC057138 TaxID=3346031 RepID=UPI00363046E6
MSHTPAPNRRDVRKAQTRQRISDVATQLFARHGFDQVTVGQIAEAADVSKVTVFNHFPRKEDMLLDRAPEAEQLITDAIAHRAENQTPLASLRDALVARARTGQPLGGFADRFIPFWRLIVGSPALRDRGRELYQDLEGVLASSLAEATGEPEPHSGARLTAALALAAYRTAFLATVSRMLAGAPADSVIDDHIAMVERYFDAVERAVEGAAAPADK